MNFNSGIFIDDGGTPGAKPPSSYLHTRRKSWAAVIVPESISEEVAEVMSLLLRYAQDEFGVEELHFTEIYSGKGKFKGVSIEKRLELFSLMGRIFGAFDLPILFQTLSPEYFSEIENYYKFREKFGFFNLSNFEHLALFFLLIQIRQFILDNPEEFTNSLPVYIDEGMVKAGNKLKFDYFSDVFKDGEINYVKSNELPYLQLADYAAFSISRTQWLVAKGNLSPLDKTLLNIVHSNELNAVNLNKNVVFLDQLKPGDYELILEKDRLSKGMSNHPEDEYE